GLHPPGGRVQAGEHRQGEGGGLARARLGDTGHVPAGEQRRDGRRLDLGGGGEAERADGREQVGGQVEAGERGHVVREGRRLLLRACGGGGGIDRHSRAQALSSGL